ncbi:MAG TPA: hypothetical protein VL988_04245 [Solirubrobacteraceae bacterium]|nr:hypothetical protein [Solirubrobacteraceae bacterium]
MPLPKPSVARPAASNRKRLLALPCVLALALGLSACAKTVSSNGLKGDSKDAAETIKNFQTHVTSGDEKKICGEDLAKTLVSKLSAQAGGCEGAIKDQLKEVDNFEVTLEAMQASGTTATAHVRSIYSGKNRKGTLTLVKEAGKWKISGLG